jgi:hypothetical protein
VKEFEGYLRNSKISFYSANSIPPSKIENQIHERMTPTTKLIAVQTSDNIVEGSMAD